MGVGILWRHTVVLMWKNAVLKLRHWGVLFLELALPTIIMIGILGLKQVATTRHVKTSTPATYWDDGYANITDMLSYCPCDGENLVWRCVNSDCQDPDVFTGVDCQRKYIAVTPYSTSSTSAVKAAVDFLVWTEEEYPSNDVFIYFEDESSFTSYVDNSAYSVNTFYPIFSAAIVFDAGYPNWQYQLRLNQSFFRGDVEYSSPSTAGSNYDFSLRVNYASNGDVGLPYNQAYEYIGAHTAMDLVASYAATMTCRYSGVCNANETITTETAGVVDFPNPNTYISSFWSSAAYFYALIFIVSILYPLANVISTLVKEKEAKLREGMLMMSLREEAYWISWIVDFFCLFFVLSILLTIVSSGIFSNSNGIYIWIYFFVFFMASVSYCFFVSTLFNKSRTASIVGVLFFFVGFFIYVGLMSSTTATSSRSPLLAAMLHPATAFTYATISFAEWEQTNAGITENTWNESNIYPITLQDCINMMFADFFIYGFLCWYLNQVFPSEFGTRKPFYFFLLPSYWIGCGRDCLNFCGFNCRPKRTSYQSLNSVGAIKEIEMTSTVEEVTENLKAQIDSKTCVDIRGLHKEFKTSNGVKVAVDNFSLTMFSGQITSLLGHNGAGKTTLISILTGLITCDDGDALVEGLSINDSMDLIRKNLGVCPQHDILFRDLTVEEHLIMFASFKGLARDKIKAEVEKMIVSVGLTEKRREYSQNLSGGQKRKLSVAIAFVGGSRVVILDEPTSGMDPYSRRFTWNVIRQHRENRVIVLTTHFMDEADLLGDRIAIMGDGRLLCCGSSLFLKRMYGVGYNMTMEKSDAVHFNSNKVFHEITNHVPDAKILTDVGAEMTVQLPFSSSNLFQRLFQYLDGNLQSLGIRSYGMSVTTLEEVFINVANRTQTQARALKGKSDENRVSGGEVVAVKAAELVDVETQEKGELKYDRLHESQTIPFFFRHMYGMLLKRYFYFIRDQKTWFLQIFLPVLFVLAGMLVMRFTSFITHQPRKTLQVSMYNEDISYLNNPTAYNTDDLFCPPTRFNTNSGNVANGTCYDITGQDWLYRNITNQQNWPAIALPGASTIKSVSEYLSAHAYDYEAMQVGAITYTSTSFTDNRVEDVSYVIHANYSAIHGAPLFCALAGSGVVKSIDSSATFTAILHPLPLSGQEIKIYDNYNANLIVIFLLLAIPFIPAAWASYVVREKEVKAKHVQMVSGVSVVSYWLATWLWDFLAYQVTMWCFIILFAAFPNTESISSTSTGALGVTITLLILFGLSMSALTYLTCFWFATPSGAQVTLIFGVFVAGLLLTIFGFFLRILTVTSRPYLNGLRYLLALFPPFALGDALNNMTLIDLYSSLELTGGQTYNLHDWKISGLNITFLAWESGVYILLVILFEYLSAIPSIRAMMVKVSKLPTDNDSVKDEDVLAEEQRVFHDAEYAKSSNILIRNIKKMYPGGKYAVKGVSLGIPKGECFGLLGINGAGKSSLLSILSGDIQPTSGDATLAGYNILTQIHACRRQIGFCPQFDALFELLTGREHLQLYARIKGIYEKDIERVVNHKIAEMGLTEYADRAAGTYSGGNKRKLSVAIAMIGEPNIVFLDEPSTGMDPVARRFMWEVITNIVTKKEQCSMILTTHSMEECEALCTRLGIMVGGTLRCLGSTQRLRSRYGEGFQLEFGFVVPSEDEITSQLTNIVRLLNLQPPKEGLDYRLTLSDIQRVLSLLSHDDWIPLVTATGSADDLYNEVIASGYIGGRSFANWIVMEENYDRLTIFLKEYFDGYQLRERQISKVRIEVPSKNSSGQLRQLASMFGSIESNKAELRLEEYSVSETSLEQIFNYFAAQQEEETGHAAGIAATYNAVNTSPR